MSMSQGDAPLRKDHRVTLKLVEAKGVNRGEECDTYCSVRVWNNAAVDTSKDDVSRAYTDDDTRSTHSESSTRKLRRHTGKGHRDVTSAKASRTKHVLKSSAPWFDEEFELELTDDFKELTVELFQKNMIKDKLLGAVTMPKYSFAADSRVHEEWYPFRPLPTEPVLAEAPPADDTKQQSTPQKVHEFAQSKITTPQMCELCHGPAWSDSGDTVAVKCQSCGMVCHSKCCARSTSVNCASLGQIRIKYAYIEDYMLPMTTYPKMLELLSDDDFHVVHALGRATDEREEVAKTLVTIFENAGQAVRYLQAVAEAEIDATLDANTIFRANSLGSKSIDQYMKLTAQKYLKGVLQPIIAEILLQNRSCELDPTRLESGDDKEEQFTVLEAYIKWALDRILSSAVQCPPHLRKVFQVVRAAAVAKFKDDKDISYTVVTAFIFLRFFNAAILGPQLFGLSTDGEPPNSRNARTLTLMSKTIQQLANMTPFDGRKEPFMVGLNYLVESNVSRMKKFVDDVSTAPSDEVLLKPKKKEGKSALGKLLQVFKSSNKDDGKSAEVVDIVRHLAALHRHLMKNIDKMVETCTDAQRPDVLKMQAILNELLEIYDRKTQVVMKERDSMLSNLSKEIGGSAMTISRGKSPLSSDVLASKAQIPASIPEQAGNDRGAQQ